VLAAAFVLTVSAVQLGSASRSEPTRAYADIPHVQAVVAEAQLVPSPTPLPEAAPAPVPAPVPAVATGGHHRHRAHRSGRHGRRVSRGARRAVHRPVSRWRSSGGRDIGWPQCSGDLGFRGRHGRGQPMPDPGVRFVIVGLTNGRSLTPNPCLDRHLRWVRDHHVQAAAYSFGTFPTHAQLRRYRHGGPYDGRHRLGALANAGHASARYNVRLLQQHGFVTPHVWIDVEPSSSRPWSRRTSWNRAVVRGWVRGYRDAGYTVGVYSTRGLWTHIVGRMRLRLPEWRTAGPVSPGSALRKCGGESIQGGHAVIAQWWTAHRDFDRLCPGPSRAASWGRYFHQW